MAMRTIPVQGKRNGGSCPRWITIGEWEVRLWVSRPWQIRFLNSIDRSSTGTRRLLDKNGFPALIQEAKRFKIKGKGHEVSPSFFPLPHPYPPLVYSPIDPLYESLCRRTGDRPVQPARNVPSLGSQDVPQDDLWGHGHQGRIPLSQPVDERESRAARYGRACKSARSLILPAMAMLIEHARSVQGGSETGSRGKGSTDDPTRAQHCRL